MFGRNVSSPEGQKKMESISKCMEYLMSSLFLITDHSESLIATLAPKNVLLVQHPCPAGWLEAKILVETQI